MVDKEFYFIPSKNSEYNPELNAIGIDLGTTESVIRKNGADFVQLDGVTSSRTMPSYVAFDEKEPKFGQIVIDRMRYKSEYSVYDSKRIIGKSFDSIPIDPLWSFQLLEIQKNPVFQVKTFNGTDRKSAEEISGALLKYIKSKAETYQNQILTDVVIAIPSMFSDNQKKATLKAAKLAGWETIHFIPEPIAAAFAYFTEITIPDKSNILIFDCGGGTVDVCIARIDGGKLNVLSCDGDSYLGGRDFDNLLFTYFDGILKFKHGYDIMKSTKKIFLKQKCQEIKHKLSVADEDWLDVEDFDQSIDEIIKITKDEFETMSSTFIVRIKEVLLRAVTKAKITKKETNYVFQVGGGCRMPMIKTILKNVFPNANHQCNLYPDWIVAHGAALYAYYLKSGKNISKARAQENSSHISSEKQKPYSNLLNYDQNKEMDVGSFSSHFEHTRKLLIKDFTNILNKRSRNIGYEELYRRAHAMITEKHGDLLYNDIKDVLTTHLKRVLLPGIWEASDAENFLSFIFTCWMDFNAAVLEIRDIVYYLDKVYIQQERRDLPGVRNLGVQLFRDNIVVFIKDKLIAAMLIKIKMNRDHNLNEWTDIKAACTMLLQLGQNNRNFYEEVFEYAFLQNSAEYYRSFRNGFAAENDETIFLQKTNSLKKLEEERADCFLDEISKARLMKMLNDEFTVA